jgi:hypothetical protein
MNDNIVEKDTLPEVILLMPISSVLYAIEPILQKLQPTLVDRPHYMVKLNNFICILKLKFCKDISHPHY